MTMISTDALTGGTLHELPPEAGDTTQPRFEVKDEWLRTAEPPLQKTAVWRWFATRYEEMEPSTPHDSEGNFFLGVKDPPVSLDAVLRERFGDVVPHDVLDSLISDVQRRAGDQWVKMDLDKLSS